MKKFSRNIGIYLIIFGLVLAMAWFYNRKPADEAKEVNYTTLVEHVKKEEVKKLVVDNNKMEMTATLTSDKKVKTTYTLVDYSILAEEYLANQVADGKVKLSAEPPERTPWYISMLPTIIMILVLVFFWFMIMNQQGGGGKAMQFGKSKAKLQKGVSGKKITFKEVAGLKEEKEELEEVVDFLKYPKKYNALGARIPKGILLVGPPGTGKT